MAMLLLLLLVMVVVDVVITMLTTVVCPLEEVCRHYTVSWLSHRCLCVIGLHLPPHPRNHGPAASHGEPDSHHDGAGSYSDCK